ncbi:MAG TPA: NADH-quinone oxidoreductase subunit NuoE [Dehalococcoidia bacterium]|jgi:NADH-quinone oxidoreductase subunit E|nr:NADH-quinone oxidoreductase subunit NuoE [Dehalococcoidia bacterium]
MHKELADDRNDKSLLSILHNIQREWGYLPEEKLREIAVMLGMPLIDVCGVATFYKSFSLTPKGRHQIKVCLGTACHVRGANRILKEVGRKLGIKPGETSEDGEFSLEIVMCLGCCAIGPVVVMDDRYYGKMTTAKLESMLMQLGGKVHAF